jgi:hypothetical protein
VSLAVTASTTAAVTIQAPAAVQAWPNGWIATAVARHTSGNYVVSVTERDATSVRFRVTHITAASTTTNVSVDYVFTAV